MSVGGAIIDHVKVWAGRLAAAAALVTLLKPAVQTGGQNVADFISGSG